MGRFPGPCGGGRRGDGRSLVVRGLFPGFLGLVGFPLRALGGCSCSAVWWCCHCVAVGWSSWGVGVGSFSCGAGLLPYRLGACAACGLVPARVCGGGFSFLACLVRVGWVFGWCGFWVSGGGVGLVVPLVVCELHSGREHLFVVQVVEGIRWMPWHQEPMKDVGGCVKPRGVASQTLIRGFPNGGTWPESCRVAAV